MGEMYPNISCACKKYQIFSEKQPTNDMRLRSQQKKKPKEKKRQKNGEKNRESRKVKAMEQIERNKSYQNRYEIEIIQFIPHESELAKRKYDQIMFVIQSAEIICLIWTSSLLTQFGSIAPDHEYDVE